MTTPALATPSSPDEAQPDLYVVTHANPAEQAKRWRLHHQIWGEGFDLTLYLRREAALCEQDYCRNNLKMWQLCDTQGDVLASLETYATHFWSMGPEGKVSRLSGQTIASVVVDPRLRNHGYASTLMQRVVAEEQLSGTRVTTLYSDVGPQMYRRSGHMLHPAQELVRHVDAGVHWPAGVAELGMGDMADLLAADAEQQGAWLGGATVPAITEIGHVEHVAWFHTRSQYRSWARGMTPTPVVGATAGDNGWCVWTADAAEPVLHVLAWRPRGAAGAKSLTEACLAHAAERRLTEVVWWDADRDTGLDPYHREPNRPDGTAPRPRDKGLPMLAWLQPGTSFPLLWMGIERLGWR
jgi:GNAT superfamily N-acetyltransferase